ncbi:MAG: succinate dehydrogenase [Phycisphaerales bacterium]
MDRHYFLLRRLHSLSGVVPIGVFLIPHLTTNSSIVWGQIFGRSHYGPDGHAGVETFQHEVNFIHSLPFLVLIEIFVLWLPIAFHAGLGVYYAMTGRSNLQRYAYQDNWRYTLQRLTGYIGIVYIFLHISSLRWHWTYGGLLPTFDAQYASSTTAEHFQAGGVVRQSAVIGLYVVGVLALVFHFANGLWTAAITWGVTITEKAQERWGYVCAAIGAGLAAAGLAAIFGFATVDIDKARLVEERMLAGEVTPDEEAPGHGIGEAADDEQ